MQKTRPIALSTLQGCSAQGGPHAAPTRLTALPSTRTLARRRQEGGPLCRCACLEDVEEPGILAIPYFESGCSQLAIPDSGGDAPARRAAGTRRPSPYRSEATKLYADKCGIPPRVHRARPQRAARGVRERSCHHRACNHCNSRSPFRLWWQYRTTLRRGRRTASRRAEACFFSRGRGRCAFVLRLCSRRVPCVDS